MNTLEATCCAQLIRLTRLNMGRPERVDTETERLQVLLLQERSIAELAEAEQDPAGSAWMLDSQALEKMSEQEAPFFIARVIRIALREQCEHELVLIAIRRHLSANPYEIQNCADHG